MSARLFEELRPVGFGVAYRMVGTWARWPTSVCCSAAAAAAEESQAHRERKREASVNL